MREITITELKELQSQGKNILVDVKAKWCMPCKQLIPRLENIQKDYNDVEFVTIDVDDNQEGCMELGIRSVPTVMVYNGEELINRSQGEQSDGFYKDILNNL
jgi:thioredoxin 1